MSALFGKKKSSALDKRIQKVQEQMDSVGHDLRLLSRFVEKPNRPVDLSKLKSVTPEQVAAPLTSARIRQGSVPPGRRSPPASRTMAAPPPLSAGPAPAAAPAAGPAPKVDARAGYRGAGNAHDERFADYFASSFEASRPLRQARRILRNKVIAMIVVVVFLVIWLVYRISHL